MKNIKGLCLALLILFAFVSTAKAAQQQPTDLVVSQDALIKMSDQSRNALFEGLEKAKKLEEASKKSTISEETAKAISTMDVQTFKGKTDAIADAVVAFCDKLGVKVNEFIKTPAGNGIILGVLYKMGVFGSIWAFVKGSIFCFFIVILMILINTRKVITTQDEHNREEKVVVPRFCPIFSGKKDEQTAFCTISTIVLFVVLCFTVTNM